MKKTNSLGGSQAQHQSFALGGERKTGFNNQSAFLCPQDIYRYLDLNLSSPENCDKLQNIYLMAGGDWLTHEIRRYFITALRRFKFPRTMDKVSQEFGFRLTNQGVIYEDEGAEWDEIDYSIPLQWIRTGDDNHVLHLEWGDLGQKWFSVENGWNTELINITLDELLGIFGSESQEVAL